MSALERARDENAGSPGGLEQVYLANRPALLRFLRARGAADEAEDLLQEMWIKASAGATGPIRDPLPYLYRTANNLMLDRRRAAQRQAKRDADWVGAEPGIEPADERPDAEQSALARDELDTAEAALAQLGERTDTIFRRFRLRGESQRDIAADLGISLSAVEKHLQKAYRALVDLRRRLDAG
ncbi:RNA polymerase sigma factor [Sphingosinicella sp. BN140058]|uniref:RNA polymerase sigma factor n=1 Tax=Sphingosinicella sp. BN140058 TaxID=1892855 RepID=UPI0010121B87|nr:RNA polymerase sigma factor [Sphingosinicella sp. BN140058]QAY78240.1 RNA polymerase sigma factor [Sphingosinicella sp. BN140058]